MDSISDYKGLILITFIILAILYFSPDLECMLLFSGILVNIITICLNTGALKIPTLKDKISNKEDFLTKPVDNNSDVPRFEMLTKDDTDFSITKNNNDSEVVMLKDAPFPKEKYKGAIDYADSSQPMQIAADRIPLVSTTHQGINTRRQIAGASNRRALVYPAIARELDEEEKKRWWGEYDAID